jgi:uncharacterized membrane protein
MLSTHDQQPQKEESMESPTKFLGHPVHPMLIAFPIGLLVTAVVFDIIGMLRSAAYLFSASYYMIVAGIIGGLIAAVFGTIDWLAIPTGTRAKRVGLWHGIGNVVVVVLFIASWYLRRTSPENPPQAALAFSFIAILLALITAWLGGELVDRLGVGVDPGAHLDASSSLSGRAADEDLRPPNLKRIA